MLDADQLMALCVTSIVFHESNVKVHDLIAMDVLSRIKNCECDW